ncbi:hypothetical protein FI667_g7479, partial [Globisporangium splendens]
MLFGGISTSSTHQKQTKRARVKRFIVDKPKQMWKAASWSFSATEVQAKLRGAKQKCRRSNTSIGFHESSTHGESRDSFAEWALLFSNEYSAYYQQQHDHGSDQAQDGPETLFGCRLHTATRGQDGENAACGLGIEEERVDLVRSDAFTLFGPCYVVRVQTVTSTYPASSRKSHADEMAEVFSDFRRSPVVSRSFDEDQHVVHVVPWESSLQTADTVFSGNQKSWEFWDEIWRVDDEQASLYERDDEVECGFWSYDDGNDVVECDVEVWDVDEPPERVTASEDIFNDDCNAFSLFGSRVNSQAGVSSAPRHLVGVCAKDEVESDAFTLFG